MICFLVFRSGTDRKFFVNAYGPYTKEQGFMSVCKFSFKLSSYFFFNSQIMRWNTAIRAWLKFSLLAGMEGTICLILFGIVCNHLATNQSNHSPMTNIPDTPAVSDTFKIRDSASALTIFCDDQALISYQYAVMDPPSGVSPNYRRSGFIHPVRTPDGQVLTRIQPPDHYHHYGLWNPWTRVLYRQDTLDFWNIGGGNATVRFAELVSKAVQTEFAELVVRHEHVVLRENGKEEVALDEWQTIRVYKPDENMGNYAMDISVRMSCAGEEPFEILTYRYGGMCIRATEQWDKSNSQILSSEGLERDQIDASRARWILAQGPLGIDSFGGFVFMSHPSNYTHPEPLRIWDSEQNKGRGDVFINFSPTKFRNWKLMSGQHYQLRYGFMIYNGKLDISDAEKAWVEFKHRNPGE